MVQAARSGVQNIAEGSEVSATSKKMELKLTQVARASLEELRLDYEDFLRHRNLPLWARHDPRRRALVARRCTTADEVAAWIMEVAKRDRFNERDGRDGQDGQDGPPKSPTESMPSIGSIGSIGSIPPIPPIPPIPSRPSPRSSHYPEISANAAHVLIGVACALLDRQIAALAAAFEKEGGFTERLYRLRSAHRKNPPRY